MGYLFLELAEILDIHTDQIERYGGAPGIRDLNLVQSAIAMPAATFGGVYLHPSIYEMAAAYLFHIVQNHPFVDGNKRAGTVAAIVFLKLNGYELFASNDELVEFVTGIASGKRTKTDAARFFEKFTRKSKGN